MINVIKNKIKIFLDFIKPVKDIAYFLLLFLIFEFVWKLCIDIGDDREQLIILGNNITHLTLPFCQFDAQFVYFCIHNILNYPNYAIDGTLIYFEGDNNLKMNIIWSCSSIKQIALFTFIMLCYHGPWKKKMTFIPLSIMFLILINSLRLTISAFLIKDGFPNWFIPLNEVLKGVKWDQTPATYWMFYKDWYHAFHDGFFTWVYYDGIMFLLWLHWQERINIPYQKHKTRKPV
ncbi:MAG: hypothetical protein RL662_1902 [Bacteroidota bacterium]|jgi:exosortase/archaeosortase family protein